MSIIHHLEYYVADLNPTKSFWQTFLADLGFKVYQEFEKGISYQHKEGTYIVFVEIDMKKKTKNNRHSTGLNHIAFTVESTEELERFHTKLISQNIKVLKKDQYHLCFEDNNEFAVELFVK